MNMLSARRSPAVSVFLSRSEPARSTRLSLHLVTTPDESTRDLMRTISVKIACPRVEVRLSWWTATCRLALPSKSILSASSSERTGTVVRFLTDVSPLRSSKMCRSTSAGSGSSRGSVESRSWSTSLWISTYETETVASYCGCSAMYVKISEIARGVIPRFRKSIEPTCVKVLPAPVWP